MPIKQRGKNKIWWLDIALPDGRRLRQSTGTTDKKQALELHDKIKADSWKIDKLGAKPRYTWQQAVLRWLEEMNHKKSLETDKAHLRWLDQYLGNATLDDIDKAMLEKIKEAKKATGVSNSTVNRLLTLVKAILNKAKDDWEWIDTVPKSRKLQEPPSRLRWLTQEEARRLLAELPSHLNAMMRFTLATGLREANVTHLTWSQIDMQRRSAWIHATQSKSGKAIAVPLNEDALTVLREQGVIRQQSDHDRVFTYNGKPCNDANGKAWRKALERAGIEDFHWHDLRHTWASWHIQNGTTLKELQELGGWASLDMVLKYAHLSSVHLENCAKNVTLKNTESVTNSSQVQNS